MSFQEIALSHAALGLYVFPVAKNKSTRTTHGYKDATLDPEQIRAWWATMPSANPGFAPGVSGVAVLDIDHGLTDMASFLAWCERNDIPPTYVVRSGSRPEFKVHLYFKGAIPDVGIWALDGCSGQVKSLGGYVLAAGSEALHGANHDKPGAPYEAICGTLGVFAPLPDVIRQLRKPTPVVASSSKVPKTAWSLPVHAGENRTGFLLEQTGAMRNLGCGKDAILARMVELNDDPEIIADPVDGDRLESTASNCAKFPVPEAEPRVVIGQAPATKVITNWRERYHTFDEVNNAPEPTFLIDGFLQEDIVTAIAAPVTQRKTIIAWNVVRALLTGEALFDHFTVTKKLTRVIYLCPEMGVRAIARMIRLLGLMPYVGETLFLRSMNSEGKLRLGELTAEEVSGALVVLDTAVRFTEGDENSAEAMKGFSQLCFDIMKRGAAAMLVLYHSGKETKQASELSLENAMRGSGELGAAVSSCWATRLQDPEPTLARVTPSYLLNVKQRDFESVAFEATSGPDYRMRFVTGSEGVKIAARPTGPKVDVDGKQAEADAIILENYSLSPAKLEALFKAKGIPRKENWIRKAKKRLLPESYAKVQGEGGKMPRSAKTMKRARKTPPPLYR